MKVSVAFTQVNVTLGELKQYVGDVVHVEDHDAHFLVAGRVRHYDECHRQEMVNQHDEEIFSLRVHINGGVHGVNVEAALDQVEPLYLKWYVHAKLPVYVRNCFV